MNLEGADVMRKYRIWVACTQQPFFHQALGSEFVFSNFFITTNIINKRAYIFRILFLF